MSDLNLVLDGVTVGTFIKTDSHQVVEILGYCNLDFAVVDAQHAPFDRAGLDRMLLAGRAAGLPLLVRIPDFADATILSVLDMGAAGIVAPQVDRVEDAVGIVAAAQFIGGRRGISLGPRFSGYGTVPRSQAIAAADRNMVLCQIESAAAVDAVGPIADVAGVGGLVIGRSDLALSMGLEDPKHPRVMEAVAEIIAAGAARDMPVVMVVASAAEASAFTAMGLRIFIVGSDQSLMRGAAAGLRGALTALAEKG